MLRLFHRNRNHSGDRPEDRSNQITGLDAFDTFGSHLFPGCCQRAVEVDGPAGILNNQSLETQCSGIQRCPCDTKISGQSGYINGVDSTCLKVRGQTRR